MVPNGEKSIQVLIFDDDDAAANWRWYNRQVISALWSTLCNCDLLFRFALLFHILRAAHLAHLYPILS